MRKQYDRIKLSSVLIMPHGGAIILGGVFSMQMEYANLYNIAQEKFNEIRMC